MTQTQSAYSFMLVSRLLTRTDNILVEPAQPTGFKPPPETHANRALQMKGRLGSAAKSHGIGPTSTMSSEMLSKLEGTATLGEPDIDLYWEVCLFVFYLALYCSQWSCIGSQ